MLDLRMRRLIAALVAGLLCLISPAAQTDKTDEFIAAQIKEQRIPGWPWPC
jgi:hypothetical protein